MTIGIDGNEANTENKVGISEYAFQLLTQLKEFPISNSSPELAERIQFQIYLKEKQRGDMPQESKNWNYRILKPGKLWTQWRLPLDLYLHQPRPGVFFSPTHYAPRLCPVPTVISIMDLSYLYFPEMFKKHDLYQLRSWTRYSIKKAKRVLTISNSTKFDIMREYKTPEEKVIVIYPGVKPVNFSSGSSSMSDITSKYGISDNFVLFVGTLQPRKNIARLIEAFAKVLKSAKVPKDLQLVIIGKKGWLYEEILKKPNELHIEEKVKFPDFISDEELILFYKQAICFILPSLYEGFGLPVLEAMKYACPVITSNVSSLPEAGGDAALYINPNDVNDIAEKLGTLITDKNLRLELIEKGKRQVAKFSWERTARETLKVLEEVVHAR